MKVRQYFLVLTMINKYHGYLIRERRVILSLHIDLHLQESPLIYGKTFSTILVNVHRFESKLVLLFSNDHIIMKTFSHPP